MALVKCKACGNDVATTAKACPKCGAAAPAHLSGGQILSGLVFGGIAIYLFATFWGGGSTDGTETREARVVETVARYAPPPRPPLQFGKPAVKKMSGLTTVMVEVRNAGSTVTSCTLVGTFKLAGEIVAVANGAVNDLPAGDTKTAQLMAGEIRKYDSLKVEESACF